jgi:hypothetical protein
MSALLALIPTKEWFIGAAFAVLLVMGWHYYDKYQDAVSYAATVKAESETVSINAALMIHDLTTQYSADLAANKVIYENELHAADLQHTSDAARLRALATARQSDAVLRGSAGLTAAIAAWSARLGRVEGISNGLADALRFDDAVATACWRERDSLTGK